MSSLRIRRPAGGEMTQLADWLEARMIVEGLSRMPRSRLRRYLRGVMAIDKEELDLQAELLFQEMARRRRIAGEMYPFVEERTGMGRKDTEAALPYVFLLCLVTSESLRSETRQAEVDQMLDNLAEDALRRYLAGESRGLRFGWPPSGDRPGDFRDAVEWLAELLGLRVGKGRRRPKSKDGGVDVVVWRPFKDGREGFITILAQCTVALDWEGKGRDIIEDIWRGWIDFGKDPVTCLVVPFVIPHPFEKWDELRRTVTFVLDRLRLCELLDGVTLSNESEVSEWTAAELGRMGARAREA